MNQFNFDFSSVDFNRLTKILVGKAKKKLDYQTAQDVVQNTLIYAMRKFNPSNGASFETFAGVCLQGRILDQLRKSYRKMNHHDIATIRTKDNEDMELEDLKNRPSDLMETILEIELDGIQNQILSYSIEGFKGNEIAEKLGVSTSTISKELNEVREKIRKEIF